ncbi:unnamed protein product [Moneuplotes crassus]|uniref:Uncharacterized protein n=1 Tax=Euplotes crassus TaxID=5936 RepID=A0AAD1XXU0_EUPCR|nr:unnamed protein product [Moneuplotes crassus]
MGCRGLHKLIVKCTKKKLADTKISLNKSLTKLSKDIEHKLSRNQAQKRLVQSKTSHNYTFRKEKQYARKSSRRNTGKVSFGDCLKNYQMRLKPRKTFKRCDRNQNLQIISKALNLGKERIEQSPIDEDPKRVKENFWLKIDNSDIFEEPHQNLSPPKRVMQNFNFLGGRPDSSPIVSARNHISKEFLQNTSLRPSISQKRMLRTSSKKSVRWSSTFENPSIAKHSLLQSSRKQHPTRNSSRCMKKSSSLVSFPSPFKSINCRSNTSSYQKLPGINIVAQSSHEESQEDHLKDPQEEPQKAFQVSPSPSQTPNHPSAPKWDDFTQSFSLFEIPKSD